MRLVLLVFGWYMVLVGGLLAAAPAVGKKLADLMLRDKTVRVLGVIPLGLGVLFLWAAPASRAPVFIQVLGWVTVFKGLYTLFGPASQLAAIMTWWHGLPQGMHRVWGLVALAIGAAVLVTL